MKTIKRNIFPIIVLLLALAIIAYFLLGEKSLDGVRQDLKPAETTVSKDVDVENRGELTKVCYLKKTPSATDKTKNNIEYLEVNYSQNAVVTGYLNENGKKGAFVGAQNGDLMNIIFSGKLADKIVEEQILYKIKDKTMIKAADGKVKENENGIKMYADILTLKYPAENAISEVDCKTIVAEEVGLKK